MRWTASGHVARKRGSQFVRNLLREPSSLESGVSLLNLAKLLCTEIAQGASCSIGIRKQPGHLLAERLTRFLTDAIEENLYVEPAIAR
jgi:hypothetical protein